MKYCKCNCSCKGIPDNKKIGIVMDFNLPTRDVIQGLDKWKCRYLKVGNNYPAVYNTPSWEFLMKYGLKTELVKYLSTYTDKTTNFWVEPETNVLIDNQYTYNLNQSLINYIESRNGVLIFICKKEKSDEFIKLFNSVKSSNKSIIFLITVDANDTLMDLAPNFISMDYL